MARNNKGSKPCSLLFTPKDATCFATWRGGSLSISQMSMSVPAHISSCDRQKPRLYKFVTHQFKKEHHTSRQRPHSSHPGSSAALPRGNTRASARPGLNVCGTKGRQPGEAFVAENLAEAKFMVMNMTSSFSRSPCNRDNTRKMQAVTSQRPTLKYLTANLFRSPSQPINSKSRTRPL